MPDRDDQTPAAGDPARQFAEFAEQTQRIFQGFLERQAAGEAVYGFDPAAIARTFWDWNARLWSDPEALASAQRDYFDRMSRLFTATGRRMAQQEAEPVATPARGDRRFKDPAWTDEAVFDHLKQAYLIYAEFAQGLADRPDGMDPHAKRMVSFHTRRALEAMSPANFAYSNPAVLRKARETGGQSLVKGFSNLLRDFERGKGQLKITMTDPDAFEVGRNLAYTEGAVIHENDLMQLIQYAPSTETVYRRPLLIVPPWINKYYALDLTADKSMVKWLVDQGYSVFLISWVNPGPELAQKGFDDYVSEGLLAALDVVCAVTGAEEVNVAGYCIGGTLTATTLAYLAATGDRRIHSATLMACMTDFTDAGDLSVFIDDDQLETLRMVVENRRYHSGDEMAGVFSLMRANDLIWSHVVNNYLMAEESLPFDMVYWFQDSTRLPARMILWYLDNCYNRNLLAQPGGVEIRGVPLDLRKIDLPVYFLSTEEDHICPWASTYQGMRLFGGEKTFVLGGSGHNSGVVNPPTKSKYGYRTNAAEPDTAEAWLDGATRHEGSWWPHWHDWLSARSGDRDAPALQPGTAGYPALEPAPGRYVKVR